MKGSIWPRPSEKDPVTGKRKAVRGSTWTYQFEIEKAGGGRQFKSKGGFRTRKDAEAALAEALTDHTRTPGAVVEPSKMMLATYLRDEWLPTLQGLKATTRKGYRDLAEAYLIPHLGERRICDLTPGQIAKFYDELRTSGRRRPKADGTRELSESTVHYVHVALSASMRHAVEAGFLRVSPVSQLPRNTRPKVCLEPGRDDRLVGR